MEGLSRSPEDPNEAPEASPPSEKASSEDVVTMLLNIQNDAGNTGGRGGSARGDQDRGRSSMPRRPASAGAAEPRNVPVPCTGGGSARGGRRRRRASSGSDSDYQPEEEKEVARARTTTRRAGAGKRHDGPFSTFRGVSWSKMDGKWLTQCYIDDDLHKVGLYDDEEQAARAYDRRMLRHHGNFDGLNFPAKEYKAEMDAWDAEQRQAAEILCAPAGGLARTRHTLASGLGAVATDVDKDYTAPQQQGRAAAAFSLDPTDAGGWGDQRQRTPCRRRRTSAWGELTLSCAGEPGRPYGDAHSDDGFKEGRHSGRSAADAAGHAIGAVGTSRSDGQQGRAQRVRGGDGQPATRRRSSVYRGVSRCEDTGRWRARCWDGYDVIEAGFHNTEEEAAKAYDRMMLALCVEGPQLNFEADDYPEEATAQAEAAIAAQLGNSGFTGPAADGHTREHGPAADPLSQHSSLSERVGDTPKGSALAGHDAPPGAAVGHELALGSDMEWGSEVGAAPAGIATGDQREAGVQSN